MRSLTYQLSAAITETNIKLAAGVSLGAETVKQITEVVTDVNVLSNVSMVVAIVAGVVAIASAVMNFRINNIRLEMEREEHAARMAEIKGLKDERADSLRHTGTTET